MNSGKKRLYETTESRNRYLWEVLPDGAWKGKPCFIVGGGPSLETFPFEKLKGHRTIGVNLAFTKFIPTIAFSMDSRFLKWLETGQYGPAVTKRFEEMVSYRVMLETYPSNFPRLVFALPVFQNYSAGHWAMTYSMHEGLGHGNNSGYAALNLAVCLQADPIYLLGFDMKHTESRTHWHDGHPKEQMKKHIATFPKYFDWGAQKLKKAGIRVINLNYESGLTCFPKQAWQEVLI